MENPRAVAGNNSSALLDQAVANFDLVGYMLVRYETLARANMDDRIDRTCLKVLGMLIMTMSRDTRTSWAGRDFIAENVGITAKSVSNYIWQLKQLGYIVADRRETPSANNRVLMHYTLSKLSPDEIENAIDLAISSIKGDRNSVVKFPSGREVSSRQDGKSEARVPARTGSHVPAGTGTHQASSLPDGKSQAKTTESSRQDGCSKNNLLTSTTENNNISVPKTDSKEARGTRLDPTPELCKRCGTWAITNFDISRKQAFEEWQLFSDFWTSKAGQGARKVDWFKTWCVWIRNSKKNYRSKTAGQDAGLFGGSQPKKSEKEIHAEIAAQAEADGWEFKGGDM